jgi:hypothetical protein
MQIRVKTVRIIDSSILSGSFLFVNQIIVEMINPLVTPTIRKTSNREKVVSNLLKFSLKAVKYKIKVHYLISKAISYKMIGGPHAKY